MTTSEIEAYYFASMGVCCTLLAYAAFRVGRTLWERIKFEVAYRKYPRVVPYDHGRACKEPHEWQRAMLLMRGIGHGEYQLCMKCGTISGNTTEMVSEEVLTQVRERLEIHRRQQDVEAEVLERVNLIVETKIAAYVTREFPEEINDREFAAKIIKFSQYVEVARVEAQEKVAAELQAQQDFESNGWPRDSKGNA